MTERLYHLDSYLRRTEAKVVRADADKRAVTLDRTVFYPGGGGQPADHGTLETPAGTLRVERAGFEDGELWHWLDGEPPAAGTEVAAEIDWQRRYQLMRTHTSMHILCGVVWRDYQAQVTGGRMEPLKGRLDFEFASLTSDLVGEIEEKINQEVAAARDVRVRILPRDEALAIPDLIRTKVNLLPAGLREIRTVEIVGLDLQADGGTHVANTREVGDLVVSGYKSKGRQNKRIELSLQAG